MGRALKLWRALAGRYLMTGRAFQARWSESQRDRGLPTRLHPDRWLDLRTAVLAVGIALPGVLGAMMFGTSGAAAITAGGPLVWASPPVSLSEAVAMRNRGEVVRQISLGADPNGRFPMMNVFRLKKPVMATPLEAAVETGKLYMVDLLFAHGALLNDDNARQLICSADARPDKALRNYLLERHPHPVTCEGVERPW